MKSKTSFPIGIAVVCFCIGTNGFQEPAGPNAEPGQKQGKTLDFKVVEAWEKKMQFGWYGEDDFGEWRFFDKQPTDRCLLPAFRCPLTPQFEAGLFASLP